MKEFFTDGNTNVADAEGAVASHPTVIDDIVPGSGGYPDADALDTMYWYVYHYLNWVTTDYYKMRRPESPDVILTPPFPSPPGSGDATPGPGASDDDAWESALALLLSILAWLLYLAQVVSFIGTWLISVISSFGTYPFRLIIYETIELPLYNAWLALHWYLAHTGFTLPMRSEINPGLMTLGVGTTDAWATLQQELDDLSGGLLSAVGSATEPSGNDRSRSLPKEPCTDNPDFVPDMKIAAVPPSCTPEDEPSEYLRPWLYPQRNMTGAFIKGEPPVQKETSPYSSMDDATVLMTPAAGDAAARAAFETAKTEAQTLQAQSTFLTAGQTLGDPVDFTAYVVAKLTRDEAGEIANFNLDADRGYGYHCWDWVRRKASTAVPEWYQSPSSTHQYQPPDKPGYGWCDEDVQSGPSPPMHDPGPANPPPVGIRYIDSEKKFT